MSAKPETFDYSILKACGQDVFISPSVEIRRPHLVTVGHHVAIDSHSYITTEAEIGDYVHVGPHVTVIGGARSKLVVGDFATIAAGTRILAGSDEFLGEGFTSVTVPEEYRDRVKYTTVQIGRFCGIGANVVIMPGVRLGEGSVIGAGAVVTRDTEPWTIYVGAPARALKARPREKLLRYAKQLGYE